MPTPEELMEDLEKWRTPEELMARSPELLGLWRKPEELIEAFGTECFNDFCYEHKIEYMELHGKIWMRPSISKLDELEKERGFSQKRYENVVSSGIALRIRMEAHTIRFLI